jgi:succinoglycan biosynthesis transport protein ExoP
VANTLANEYVQENSRTRERHARGTSEFLKSQLDQAKRQLDVQEARINAFRMRHGRELPSGREAALSALERMASDLDRNSDAQMRIKERIAMIDTGLAIPAAPPRADGSESDEARASRLRAQLSELRQRYTDQYPDVVAVREELDQVQQRLRQSSGSATAATPSAARAEALRSQLEADLQRLREQEKQLKPSLMTYQGRLERMSGRDIELEQLSRDYLSTREQYDSLLKKYSDAALAERVELRSNGEEFSILDKAIPPAEPAAPNRLRLLMMAVVFALGLTFAVSLLMHWFDGSLHTVDDLRTMTAVPIIGTVPPIVTGADRSRGVLRASLATIAVVVAVAAAFGGASALASGNEDLVRLFSRGAS